MAETLGNAVLVLGIDEGPFRAGLDQAKRVAATEGVQVGNSFARSVSSAIATFGLGVTAVNFLKGSIDSAVELETITRKLSNTLGEQGAARALGVTRGLADQLGLSFTTLAGTFGSFTAAATAAGTPLKVQEDLFAAVAKSAQALGLSNDELSGSLLALQQIASKGTVQMEELRGQLGERLPIAFGAAAKGLGLTQQELIKLVETGRLTSDQFFPALTKGLNELTAAAGGAPTAAQNFQKLGNAWKDLQTSFGQNLLPQVIEGVKVLSQILEVQGSKMSADRLGFGTGALGSFGIFKQEALDAVAVLKQTQQQLNLTDKQANALFFDAQKLEGINNIGLAKPEQVGSVLERFRELAKIWRARYPDRTAQTEAEAAAARALLETDKQRLNTATKINDKIKELQGKQSNLDVNSPAYADAGIEIAGLKQRLGDIAKKDAEQIKSALGEGGRIAADSLISAAERFKGAGEALRGSLEGAFKFLTPQIQRQLTDNARKDIQAAQKAGIFRGDVVGFNTTPEELLSIGGSARGVLAATKTFDAAGKDLVGALNAVQSPLISLAEKDWQVVVNVASDGLAAVSGDVLGGVA